MKKYFLFIGLLLLCISCKTESDAEIAVNHKWKVGDGDFRLNDWLVFNNFPVAKGYYIKNDTIYKDEIPVALLISCDYYVDHYMMKISSIDRKRECVYFEKGEE